MIDKRQISADSSKLSGINEDQRRDLKTRAEIECKHLCEKLDRILEDITGPSQWGKRYRIEFSLRFVDLED